MLRFATKRLLGVFITALFVTFLTFCLLKAAPGDPALILLQQQESVADEDSLAEARQALGLDRPFFVQYAVWLSRIVRGDLGGSYYTSARVGDEIKRAFPVTLDLTLRALLATLIVSLVLGLASAREGGLWDYLTRAGAVFGSAVPSFWLGLLLMWIFAVQLGYFPAVGLGRPWSMVLPTLTLALGPALYNARLFAACIQETDDEEYVLFARSKGLSETRILLLHRLKPSLIPLVASLSVTVGMLLAGTVLVENIFALPGMGVLAVEAVFNRDFPVVMGYVLAMAGVFTLVNLAADLLCAWIDPRVRLEAR